MNDHIGKPFDISHVIQVLRKQAGWGAIDDLPDENIQLADNAGLANHPIDQGVGASEDSGIDIKTAISRMGGNKDLYSRMLPKFIENLTNQPIQLRALLEKGELQAASRLLHSLKGLSSTMGVTKIAAEAAHGEKLLLTEISIAEASQFIESFIRLIERQIPHVLKIDPVQMY
jgi:HPt (histidine-containing phosphotransfer) domain-containing protein